MVTQPKLVLPKLVLHGGSLKKEFEDLAISLGLIMASIRVTGWAFSRQTTIRLYDQHFAMATPLISLSQS